MAIYILLCMFLFLNPQLFILLPAVFSRADLGGYPVTWTPRYILPFLPIWSFLCSIAAFMYFSSKTPHEFKI